jgi:uncharacterized protein YecE (DUF72 family)
MGIMDVFPMQKGLNIGTSGWSYGKDWKGVFYSSTSSMLHQYLSLFDTAEINSTFYALPKENFIRHLAKVPPEKFFAAKLPKKVTHDHRLDLKGEGGQVLEKYFELMRQVKQKVPVLLVQLPPWEYESMGDLEAFFSGLDRDFRYAIEFRHESWLKKEVWALLESYSIAHVIVDEPLLPINLRVTTDFAYIRWHGHGERPWYKYRYEVEELQDWLPRLKEVSSQSKTTFGYFNNHFSGNAPLNALQMLQLLGQANDKQLRKLEQMTRSMESHQTTLTDF